MPRLHISFSLDNVFYSEESNPTPSRVRQRIRGATKRFKKKFVNDRPRSITAYASSGLSFRVIIRIDDCEIEQSHQASRDSDAEVMKNFHNLSSIIKGTRKKVWPKYIDPIINNIITREMWFIDERHG